MTLFRNQIRGNKVPFSHTCRLVSWQCFIFFERKIFFDNFFCFVEEFSSFKSKRNRRNFKSFPSFATSLVRKYRAFSHEIALAIRFFSYAAPRVFALEKLSIDVISFVLTDLFANTFRIVWVNARHNSSVQSS